MSIIEILKRIISFSRILFRDNPIKTVFLFIFLISQSVFSFYDFDNFIESDVLESVDFEVPLKRGETYYYPVIDNSGNRDWVSTNDISIIEIKNGSVLRESIHPVKIITMCIAFISLVVLLLGTVVQDRDTNWDIRSCYREYLTGLVCCDEENGIYFYHINGKLLLKSNDINDWGLKSILDAYSNNPNLFPEYKGPKYKIRNEKIMSILKS